MQSDHAKSEIVKDEIEPTHSGASKILIRNQSLFMGPLHSQNAILGGPEFGFREILANGTRQKKINNWNQTPPFIVFLKTWGFFGHQDCK